MKYFCSKCGKTTQYNLELPKFCSNCGRSFNTKINNNELKLKEKTNTIEENEEILDDENFNNINFKKIKPSFKVNVYKSPNDTFGSLIDNPSKPVNLINENNNIQKTKEEILLEFQKEAGLSRPQE